MTTNTFERKICIQSPNAVRRLSHAMNPKNNKTNSVPIYTSEERIRSEELLKQLLLKTQL